MNARTEIYGPEQITIEEARGQARTYIIVRYTHIHTHTKQPYNLFYACHKLSAVCDYDGFFVNAGYFPGPNAHNLSSFLDSHLSVPCCCCRAW